VESEKYDTLTMNELFSKHKSTEVDRGMTAKIEGLTNLHSLTLIGGSNGKSNANPSTRMFSLSSLMSVLDEEFDVLREDEVALPTRRFERPTAPRRSRTRTATSRSRRRRASTDQGVTISTSTRASTKTTDDRGRRMAEVRPERWLE
jgi:hypothetical protein